MNSAVIPFAQGIGFAMPIQPAMWIAEQLIKYGENIRPWISIKLETAPTTPRPPMTK